MSRHVDVREARLGDEVALEANCKTGATLAPDRTQVEWTVREAGFPHLARIVGDDRDAIVGNVMLMHRGAHALVGDDGALTVCLGRQGETPSV